MSDGVDMEVTGFGMPWEKDFNYSQGLKVGDTIYLSGQINHDADGNLVGIGDLEAQIRQAYANVATVLEHYGATLANVLRTSSSSPTLMPRWCRCRSCGAISLPVRRLAR